MIHEVTNRADHSKPPEINAESLLPPNLSRRLLNQHNKEMNNKSNDEDPDNECVRFSSRPAIQHGIAPKLKYLTPVLLRDVAREVYFS